MVVVAVVVVVMFFSFLFWVERNPLQRNERQQLDAGTPRLQTQVRKVRGAPGTRAQRRSFGRGCSCRGRLGQCRDGRDDVVFYHAPAAEAPTS